MEIVMSHRAILPLLGLFFGIACDQQPAGPGAAAPGASTATAARTAGVPAEATVVFGRDQLGTDFFPPGSHDASFHATDAVQPRTVVIAAGGTVSFLVAEAHKIAIYEPGVTPRDIDATNLESPGTPFPFPPIINDATGRIVRDGLVFGPAVPFSWTFDQPGKYLVICEVLPHFVESKMYGWVDVK